MVLNKSVSVIIPCFNAESFIKETIDSVLNQTHLNCDVVVVDDGSTDNSASLVESYKERVTLLKQSNSGESVARNNGAKAASGDFLLFLDADDYLHPESLERLLNSLESHDHAVACMQCAWFEGEKENVFHTTKPKDSFFPYIFSANINPIHCWLISREFFLSLGGFMEGQHYFEDWDFWFRVALEDVKIVPVDFAGAYYRQHQNQQLKTTSLVKRSEGHVLLLERFTSLIMSKHSDILEKHGVELFWGAWVAYHTAKKRKVLKEKLEKLQLNIENLSKIGPKKLTKSLFARLIRFFGLPLADNVRSIFVRSEIKVS